MHVGIAFVCFLSEKICTDLSGNEIPPSHSDQSPVRKGLAREATTPLLFDTQQPTSASDICSSPAKGGRSTQTDLQQPRVGDEKADQTAQV
jgi:hypothetical protein